MSQLIYLDFLRRVSPCEMGDVTPDFMIFGGFDALRVVSPLHSLMEMKQENEKGHETVNAAYDRQPVFLYSGNPYREDQRLFNRTGKMADAPLVVTILQIRKKKSAAISADRMADCLIEFFSNTLEKIIQANGIRLAYHSVFWNLGESDIVIVFRPRCLADVATVIHELRKTSSEDGMEVLSSCSHCGFPYQSNKQATRFAMIKWLKRERKSDTQGMLSFLNTSSAYHRLSDYQDWPRDGKDMNGAFLFGEWDYSFYWPFTNNSRTVKIEAIVDKLLESAYPAMNCPFKTSYTLPVVYLGNLGDLHGIHVEDESDWIDTIQPAYDAFADYLDTLKQFTMAQSILNSIRSMGRTMTGLAKYLHRLYLGRFEEDLYTYVKPIFYTIPKMLKSYQDEIKRRTWNVSDLFSTGRDIHRLVNEMVEDTTSAISGFQHLFSVLAVSPHTFMETFGSNMRSLTAADKLVDAYQGLVRYLCDFFPDTIQDTLTGKHHILILPYRKAYPSHKLLFKSSSPTERISIIEMDFPEMFHLENSIYAMLHECGHHLGNRLREERKEDYFSACYLMAAEKTLGTFLYEPFSAMISVVSTQKIPEKRTKLLFGISEPRRRKIITDFSDRVRGVTMDSVFRLAGVFEAAEREGRRKNEEELVKRYNGLIVQSHYSTYIFNYIQSTFQNLFADDFQEIQELLSVTVQNSFLDPMEKIALSLLNTINEEGGDAYEAARLYAKYSTGELENVILKSILADIVGMIRNKDFDSLMRVFTEIYADIFTIRILDMKEPEQYYSKMPAFTNSSAQEASVQPMNIFRIATVSRICFGNAGSRTDEEMIQKYINHAGIAAWEQNQTRVRWMQAVQSACFEYTCDYAEACNRQMLKTINSKVEQTSEIQVMRDVLNRPEKNKDNEIRFIEAFWRYLMQNG